jgi:hypothetical protein
MAKKAKLALERIKRGDFVIPSPQEVIDAMTPAGSWTALQLAEWGVAWPPKHGWRTELERKWHAARPVTDTTSLTDAAYRKAFQAFAQADSAMKAAIRARDIAFRECNRLAQEIRDRRSDNANFEEIPAYVTAPDFAYCGAEARA